MCTRLCNQVELGICWAWCGGPFINYVTHFSALFTPSPLFCQKVSHQVAPSTQLCHICPTPLQRNFLLCQKINTPRASGCLSTGDVWSSWWLYEWMKEWQKMLKSRQNRLSLLMKTKTKQLSPVNIRLRPIKLCLLFLPMRIYASTRPLPLSLSQSVTLSGPPLPFLKRDVIDEWPLIIMLKYKQHC